MSVKATHFSVVAVAMDATIVESEGQRVFGTRINYKIKGQILLSLIVLKTFVAFYNGDLYVKIYMR